MDRIIVNGGHRLRGEVVISGAKNAALPILISSLLTDEPNVYKNVPALKDVKSTLILLHHLGAAGERSDDVVTIDASGLNNHDAPYDLVRKMRASVLVLGPLLARLKRARVSLPGGCAIGERPINLHLRGLSQLGADIHLEHGYVEAETSGLRGAEIYLDVPTVTGTENLMMAAALADGTSVIRNAAREPEVMALARTLNLMGADIRDAGSSVITINGVPRLHGATVDIIPDRIEAGTFMVAAAVTHGDITLKNCDPSHMAACINKLRLAGVHVETKENEVRVNGTGPIHSIDIKTQPYPGFPTDMQAQFMVLMAVADGLSVISENIFENRFIHVGELKRMGADITVSGNSALIRGMPYLSGAPVMASDLRASASLILAGLVAGGRTEIHRVYHLDRGYQRIEEKFARLGADMQRVRG
ncbi:MAG: UDP-N-acetylglucosamine 1-carboxyvinyltransferase [Desulfobacterales bacterium]